MDQSLEVGAKKHVAYHPQKPCFEACHPLKITPKTEMILPLDHGGKAVGTWMDGPGRIVNSTMERLVCAPLTRNSHGYASATKWPISDAPAFPGDKQTEGPKRVLIFGPSSCQISIRIRRRLAWFSRRAEISPSYRSCRAHRYYLGRLRKQIATSIDPVHYRSRLGMFTGAPLFLIVAVCMPRYMRDSASDPSGTRVQLWTAKDR